MLQLWLEWYWCKEIGGKPIGGTLIIEIPRKCPWWYWDLISQGCETQNNIRGVRYPTSKLCDKKVVNRRQTRPKIYPPKKDRSPVNQDLINVKSNLKELRQLKSLSKVWTQIQNRRLSMIFWNTKDFRWSVAVRQSCNINYTLVCSYVFRPCSGDVRNVGMLH